MRIQQLFDHYSIDRNPGFQQTFDHNLIDQKSCIENMTCFNKINVMYH